MRDGDLLVGWGMATATYPAHKMSAAAKVIFRVDSSATVQCATHDLGTGAYTAFTQISSEQLGMPFEKITFELGKSDFPFGPVAGGSNSTGTVGTAIHEAALLSSYSAGRTGGEGSEVAAANVEAGRHRDGRAGPHRDERRPQRLGWLRGNYAARRQGVDRSGRQAAQAGARTRSSPSNLSARISCEVKIDPLLPRVQVTRVVSVINGGRIVNEKTARSQILGGVVMGVGMALTEETAYDRATGLPVTRNLADYHVPTNADIPQIDVEFCG